MLPRFKMAFTLVIRRISHRAAPLKSAKLAETNESHDLNRRGFCISGRDHAGAAYPAKEINMSIEPARSHQPPRTLPPPGQRNQPLFSLGQIVATPAVLKHFEAHGIDPVHYLRQHSHGVWGNVPPDDARANDAAVLNGLRILSSYCIAGECVWIITEAAPRAYSTLLFAREY